MRCKDQLDPDEEDETRQIAAVRIHVERAIERIKNYNISKQIMRKLMCRSLTAHLLGKTALLSCISLVPTSFHAFSLILGIWQVKNQH